MSTDLNLECPNIAEEEMESIEITVTIPVVCPCLPTPCACDFSDFQSHHTEYLVFLTLSHRDSEAKQPANGLRGGARIQIAMCLFPDQCSFYYSLSLHLNTKFSDLLVRKLKLYNCIFKMDFIGKQVQSH